MRGDDDRSAFDLYRCGVEIGVDTVIYPQTVLEETKVGKGCRLGQGRISLIRVGDGVLCRHSLVLGSVLEDGANVGPYAHIRLGSKIGPSVKIGDFVEIKNSSIGQGSKVSHLSYVGDAEIGPDVNMGAGSIVVNYDGRKAQNGNWESAFIGCNSNLVAPINIGKEHSSLPVRPLPRCLPILLLISVPSR